MKAVKISHDIFSSSWISIEKCYNYRFEQKYIVPLKNGDIFTSRTAPFKPQIKNGGVFG